MKILILTDRLEIGGAETHIAQLVQELAKRGEEVIVASSGGWIADRLEKQGILQIRMPLNTHSPICWLFLRHKIRALIKRERIDIAHAHARVPALLIHGIRRLGCAEIVTVHAKFRAGLVRRIADNIAVIDAALAVTTPAGQGRRLIESINILRTGRDYEESLRGRESLRQGTAALT